MTINQVPRKSNEKEKREIQEVTFIPTPKRRKGKGRKRSIKKNINPVPKRNTGKREIYWK